ncbi:MAG: MGMT family protein [Candidatus Marinimicrobia bacterium]|nr:MGMT family protein [Candidatus Neomarinimicrobiota bacterium]
MRFQPGLNECIYNLVRKIPEGKVATYGQIAALVGTSPRQVGYAMAALPDPDVPWHRVINSQGKVSPRRSGDGGNIQRALLEAEGVEFNQSGRVNLKQVLWEPDLTRL